VDRQPARSARPARRDACATSRRWYCSSCTAACGPCSRGSTTPRTSPLSGRRAARRS